MAQYSEDPWAQLLDSMGNEVFSPQGDYLLAAHSKFDSFMKLSIEIWLKHKNGTTKENRGVFVIASRKWYMRKDPITGKWSKIKRNKGE